MNKLKAFATLLLSAIGIFGAREFYKPRNIKDLLKGRGIKLSSDERVGESMFFENQSELEAMKIESPTALGGGCNEKFKITNLSDDIFNEAKKYCSDNPTTIMARVIREGEKDRLIKPEKQDAYKINYILSSDKEGVLKLLKLSEPTTLKIVAENLTKGCKDQEREKVLNANEKDKLATFKRRCYDLKVATFKELVNKQGRKLMTEPNQFKKRFKEEKLEYATELKKEIEALLADEKVNIKQRIQTIINTSPEYRKTNIDPNKDEDLFREEGGRVYKLGCEDRINKNLLAEQDERNIVNVYNQFSFRCSVE